MRLELGLTHELIGHLVGAYRPSVSVALARLEQDGYVRRSARGLMLLGSPPGLDETLKPRRDRLPG